MQYASGTCVGEIEKEQHKEKNNEKTRRIESYADRDYNDTKDGKIHWNISVQTTENNEVSEKPVEVEDGVSWTIDECYVSYYCKYKGQDFLMIT